MASTIKVNNIQNQCGANIANKCGSTVTLGASGDTITLACGASQTGFGRTGTVDWDTTAKTAGFTAVSGNGYFVNTTSGAVTMTLPATPSAGDIVSVKDYAYTFATNNLIVNRNGSPIGGATDVNTLAYSTNGDFLTFIYVDGTKGWLLTNDSTNTDQTAALFISATGGTITCCGDYKIHTFTGPGTFCISNIAPVGSGNPNALDYLVVAGGGAPGPASNSGGGGAGGFRVSNATGMPAPLTSPLATPTSLTATVTSIPVTVGAGGSTPSAGSNSVFSTITSAGGGAGNSGGGPGSAGGSGGGGLAGAGPGFSNPYPGGAGNTPPVSPPQGNNGGGGYDGQIESTVGGGGGGAGATGGNGGPTTGGNGGIGSYVLSAGFAGCNGESGPVCGARYFAGGGGGGTNCSPNKGTGGIGGGGDGGAPPSPGTAGVTNTGGGGGSGQAGGSGIVIIRYKYQ